MTRRARLIAYVLLALALVAAWRRRRVVALVALGAALVALGGVGASSAGAYSCNTGNGTPTVYQIFYAGAEVSQDCSYVPGAHAQWTEGVTEQWSGTSWVAMDDTFDLRNTATYVDFWSFCGPARNLSGTWHYRLHAIYSYYDANHVAHNYGTYTYGDVVNLTCL